MYVKCKGERQAMSEKEHDYYYWPHTTTDHVIIFLVTIESTRVFLVKGGKWDRRRVKESECERDKLYSFWWSSMNNVARAMHAWICNVIIITSFSTIMPSSSFSSHDHHRSESFPFILACPRGNGKKYKNFLLDSIRDLWSVVFSLFSIISFWRGWCETGYFFGEGEMKMLRI